MSKKTISRGVRIPLDLFNLVSAAAPGVAFSEIVRLSLVEKYGFVVAPVAGAPGNGVDKSRLGDIEFFVDHMGG